MPMMQLSAKKLAWVWGASGVLWLFASPAAAFNAKAHRVVGHVAAAHSCAETLIAIGELDGERDLAAAGVWADEVRAYKHMDFAKPWHYINVPDAISVRQFLADGRRYRRGDVLFAIDHYAQLLGDTSADRLDRAQAYRFLVHFVADVHQPLHVGRSGDQGGNRVKVRVGDRRTNLHSFWDGFDLNQVIEEPRDYAAYLGGLYQDRSADVAVEVGGNPVVWAQESKNFRAQVYGFGPVRAQAAPVLGPEYRDKAINIINLRMYQAGRRLASMLDGIFCEGAVSR